jgi:hypothetical protein
VDKFKVYLPDSETIVGGRVRVAVIEAEDEQDALHLAILKHGAKATVKRIKV